MPVKQSGANEYNVDELLKAVTKGSASESAFRFFDEWVTEESKRLIRNWVNMDLSDVKSDAGIITAHESFRQRIKAILVLQQHLLRIKLEAESAAKSVK